MIVWLKYIYTIINQKSLHQIIDIEIECFKLGPRVASRFNYKIASHKQFRVSRKQFEYYFLKLKYIKYNIK